MTKKKPKFKKVLRDNEALCEGCGNVYTRGMSAAHNKFCAARNCLSCGKNFPYVLTLLKGERVCKECAGEPK